MKPSESNKKRYSVSNTLARTGCQNSLASNLAGSAVIAVFTPAQTTSTCRTSLLLDLNLILVCFSNYLPEMNTVNWKEEEIWENEHQGNCAWNHCWFSHYDSFTLPLCGELLSRSGGLRLSFHQLDDKLQMQSTLVPTSVHSDMYYVQGIKKALHTWI